MNNDTSKFVDKYLNCENVYADHKNLRMFSQNIRLHTWKWEDLNIDILLISPPPIDNITRYVLDFIVC